MKIRSLLFSIFIVGYTMCVFVGIDDRHGSTGPGGGTTGLNIHGNQ